MFSSYLLCCLWNWKNKLPICINNIYIYFPLFYRTIVSYVCVCVCVSQMHWIVQYPILLIPVMKHCLPGWMLNIFSRATLNNNSSLFLVPLCRWSWAGSRKWWFMTRAPKRRGTCPKTALCTFSWGSWRAPSTKSRCSPVRQNVWSIGVRMAWLFVFYLHKRHGQVCLTTAPLPDFSAVVCPSTVWSADGANEQNNCSYPHIITCSSFLNWQSSQVHRCVWR